MPGTKVTCAYELFADAVERSGCVRRSAAVVAVQHRSDSASGPTTRIFLSSAKGRTPSFFSRTIDSRAVFSASSRCGALSISDSGVCA